MADPKKKDDLDSTLGLDSGAESDHKLEDIDPILGGEKDFKPKEGKSDKPIEEPSNVPEAGATGAAVGYAVEKIAPKVEAPQPKGLEAARTSAQVAGKSVERQVERVASAKAAHVSNVDAVHNELKAAQARFNSAQDKLNIARADAIKLNALPEPPPVQAPTLGSSVPVDQGAMRHNVKMGNIVDYNAVRKGLTGTTAETAGMGRLPGYSQVGRIIVPESLSSAPIYNAEQIAAQKRLAEAEAMFKTAQSEVNGLQAKWKGMVGSTPRAVETAGVKLANATEKAAQAADKVRALEAIKPTGLQRAGALVSKIPYMNVLGGALSGAELMHAIEEWKKGNYTDATMAGMGAVGGALTMVPNPYAKVGGALLSVPPLIYEGYKHAVESGEQPDFTKTQ